MENSEYRYAGFWLRFWAYVIDAIILSIVDVAILMAMGSFGGGSPSVAAGGRVDMNVNPVGLGLNFLIQWLYFALLESSSMQGTLGKKLFGLSVTDLEANRISFGRATGRYFAKFISAIILLIGFLMAGWTHRKQALHDKIAGTLVLKRIRFIPVPQTHSAGA